jgi:energy-converting hydrogenase A subunit M
MTDRLTLFDVCRCGHRRLEHDAEGCAGCRRDEDLHLAFLSVPATAHLEQELAAPVVCKQFVAADRNNYARSMQGGESEVGEDPDRD